MTDDQIVDLMLLSLRLEAIPYQSPAYFITGEVGIRLDAIITQALGLPDESVPDCINGCRERTCHFFCLDFFIDRWMEAVGMPPKADFASLDTHDPSLRSRLLGFVQRTRQEVAESREEWERHGFYTLPKSGPRCEKRASVEAEWLRRMEQLSREK